jgi:hypothetical protein
VEPVDAHGSRSSPEPRQSAMQTLVLSRRLAFARRCCILDSFRWPV